MRCFKTAFHKRVAKRADGFTLLELLVATALFLSFTTLLMQAFSMGYASIADMETVSLAYYLAENKMETLRNKAFSDIATEARTPVTNFTDFETSVDVSFPQSPNQKLKKVMVNLYFPKKGGGTRNVWLKTLIVNN